MAAPVIEVTGLRKAYGPKVAVDDVSFTVEAGEIVGILGPNGAGKTTTIEILEGFRERSGGDVVVLGEDPLLAPEPWRAGIGIVLQSWRDHGLWTVRDLLRHLGEYYAPYGTPARPRPRDVDELLDAVGLADAARQRVAKLSGGQRRRLDVAIGIVGRPEVLFLDEPTAGFDPEARRDFHDIVHTLVDRDDTTIVLTTHDLDEAEKLADRILILAGGRIVANGSADALARQVQGKAQVTWSRGGERYVHAADDATLFVRSLFTQYGDDITDLEVRRTTLEDTYISLVRKHEFGEESRPPAGGREDDLSRTSTEGVRR